VGDASRQAAGAADAVRCRGRSAVGSIKISKDIVFKKTDKLKSLFKVQIVFFQQQSEINLLQITN
jgi:hypothetical protein